MHTHTEAHTNEDTTVISGSLYTTEAKQSNFDRYLTIKNKTKAKCRSCRKYIRPVRTFNSYAFPICILSKATKVYYSPNKPSQAKQAERSLETVRTCKAHDFSTKATNVHHSTGSRQPSQAKQAECTRAKSKAYALSTKATNVHYSPGSRQPSQAKQAECTRAKKMAANLWPTERYSSTAKTELHVLLKDEVHRVKMNRDMHNGALISELFLFLCYLLRPTSGINIEHQTKFIKKIHFYGHISRVSFTNTEEKEGKGTLYADATLHGWKSVRSLENKLFFGRYIRYNYYLIMVILTRDASPVYTCTKKAGKRSKCSRATKAARLIKQYQGITRRPREPRRILRKYGTSSTTYQSSSTIEVKYTHNYDNVVISTRAVFAVIRVINIRKYSHHSNPTRPLKVVRSRTRRSGEHRQSKKFDDSTNLATLYSLQLKTNYTPNYSNVEISTRAVFAVTKQITTKLQKHDETLIRYAAEQSKTNIRKILRYLDRLSQREGVCRVRIYRKKQANRSDITYAITVIARNWDPIQINWFQLAGTRILSAYTVLSCARTNFYVLWKQEYCTKLNRNLYSKIMVRKIQKPGRGTPFVRAKKYGANYIKHNVSKLLQLIVRGIQKGGR